HCTAAQRIRDDPGPGRCREAAKRPRSAAARRRAPPTGCLAAHNCPRGRLLRTTSHRPCAKHFRGSRVLRTSPGRSRHLIRIVSASTWVKRSTRRRPVVAQTSFNSPLTGSSAATWPSRPPVDSADSSLVKDGSEGCIQEIYEQPPVLDFVVRSGSGRAYVSPHLQMRRYVRLRSLDLVQPVRQLDIGAPGVFDEGDIHIERRPRLTVRPFELDAVGLELLRERFEVLHLETDVVDRPSLRADDGVGGWREV